MTQPIDLFSDVRVEIENHVDEVDRVLRESEVSRSERQSLCDDLYCQISDMLSERCSAAPTVADVKAVLAEMDSASSYARQSVNRQVQLPVARTILPLAIGSATTAILGIIGALIWAQWRGAESDRQEAAVLAFLITSLAAAMGATAISEIRRRPETRRGYLLAFIGVISLPICFCLWANREISYPINTQLSREVANYVRSTRLVFKTPEGKIVTSYDNTKPKEGGP